MPKRILICWLLLIAGMMPLHATHIVGAELYYECVNPAIGVYDVTLKLYRDCLNGQAPYDQFITLFIFNATTGALQQTVNVPKPPLTPQIQPTDWGPCVAVIPNICVEEGIYETTLTLPPNSGGYHIAWARCCRNQAITNLSLPLGEGITFLARIPPLSQATCNSMPTFDQVPPIFLCVNEPFNFDHSATDPDGDSLAYALTNPWTGVNLSNFGAGNPTLIGANSSNNSPVVDPFGNPMGPPPYKNVVFSPGYSFTNPFGSNNFVLDPQTGFLTVTPTQTGIFVFSVSVFEYRNGVLLSENRRDYQIHIIPCLPQGVPPVITHDLTGLNHIGDTIFINGGMPFCYPITVTDVDASNVLSAYTVSAPFGNGSFIPPAATFSFTGTNPIVGQVCWTPACQYNGQKVPLVIGAFDTGDCQNISNVFDTVWVKITVPPNQPPLITPNLSGLQTSGDTIFVTANTPFCFNATITDPNGDPLSASPSSPIFNAPNGPSFTIVNTAPLTAQICWTPACFFEGQTVELSFTATDQSMCNNAQSAQQTLYVKVLVPPNQPPSISSNLSGNQHLNDTIFVDALQNFCYNFTATDPNSGDVLTVQPISNLFGMPGGPTISFSGSNPVTGQVCWTPGCQYENQVVELVLRVADQGVCANIGEDFDTVFIKVRVPANLPPALNANLAGNVVNGDTIIVTAEESLCYTFSATDPNTGSQLTLTPLTPLFNQPGGPVLTFSGSNPINGQVCWTPGCQFAGQTLPLVLSVQDNGSCSSLLSDRDTVFIRIRVPFNNPPVITPNFGSLPSSNDTIFANADESFCFTVFFTDPNSQDTLDAQPLGPIFSGPNAATFSVTGVNPLLGQVCWTPACENEGQLIPFIFRVGDNGKCNNEQETFDTVYVKISDPQTVAPIVSHDLSGTNFSNDTVFLDIGDGACFRFFIADQTTENGMNYAYEFQNMGGLNLNLATVNVVTRNDSILGEICFTSDCSNGGSTYRSIVTGIDKETCPPFRQASDTIYIRVKTDFGAFAGKDTFFCEGGGGVQLNVTPVGGAAPYYYQWGCNQPGGCGFSNSNNNSPDPIVNPTDTTVYFVQITDNNGCTSEIDDIRVNVNKLPIVDAGPDVTLCEGAPGIGLQCTIVNPLEAPGPYTYSWTPPQGLNNPATPNPFARPDTTTVYTVIVGSANGCSSLNTTLDTLSTVEVRIQPRPSVTAGPDQSICLGDTALLQGFASGAGPDYTYSWTPSFGLNDSSTQAPLGSPELTVTYFLVAFSNGCPSLADSMTVFVRTIPTVETGRSYDVCFGDSVQLNATASGDPLATGYSFAWTPAAGLSDPAVRNPLASPSVSTLYQVQATSSFGCPSALYDVQVNVLPKPVAFAGLDTALCQGDTLALAGSYTVAGGTLSGPVFYEWSGPALSNLFVANPLAAPVSSSLYTLRVSSGSCASTDEVLVDVFTQVRASVSADTNRICQGEGVQLNASGGLGGSSYLWTPAAGLDDPTLPNPIARPDTSTTYTLTLREGICEDRQSLRIEVNPAPRPDYFSSLTEGCDPLTVAFTENSGSGISFVWEFGDESPLSNESSPEHTYEAPGLYEVRFTATGPGGCTASAAPRQIRVYPRGTAAFSAEPPMGTRISLPDAAVAFSDLSQGAVSYFWDFGDGSYSQEANPTHLYQEAGAYTVTLIITDAGGCVDTFALGLVQVISPDLFIPDVFTPNGDNINEVFRVRYEGKDAYRIQIFDRWGRQMFEAESAAESWNGITPQGNEAPEGAYFYQIEIGARNFSGSLTLLR